MAAAPTHSLAYLYPITFFTGTILMSLGPVLDPVIHDLDIRVAQGGLLALGSAQPPERFTRTSARGSPGPGA